MWPLAWIVPSKHINVATLQMALWWWGRLWPESECWQSENISEKLFIAEIVEMAISKVIMVDTSELLSILNNCD